MAIVKLKYNKQGTQVLGMKIETSHQNKQTKKVVVTENCMLNGISEKGPSKPQKVTIENFSGGTNKTVAENLDLLLKGNPDDLTVQAGTSDLTKNVKLFHNMTKILKQVSREPPLSNLMFSSIIA